jgi:hypothetical protein
MFFEWRAYKRKAHPELVGMKRVEKRPSHDLMDLDSSFFSAKINQPVGF